MSLNGCNPVVQRYSAPALRTSFTMNPLLPSTAALTAARPQAPASTESVALA